MANAPIKLHRHALSGHSHRVQLFLSLIGVDHELVDVDLLNGEHKKEPFLKMNPFGQVPVIQDGDVTVSDSNAILTYLALKYADESWLPRDPVQFAQVQRFLSVAAGPLSNGPASARLVTVFGASLNAEQAIAVAEKLFTTLEVYLEGRTFLVGDKPTIADVAIYSYTAHAPEGNVSLDAYPRVRELLGRIEALPNFVPMQETKAGLRAA